MDGGAAERGGGASLAGRSGSDSARGGVTDSFDVLAELGAVPDPRPASTGSTTSRSRTSGWIRPRSIRARSASSRARTCRSRRASPFDPTPGAAAPVHDRVRAAGSGGRRRRVRLGDRFLLYALPPHGWANEYDPALPRTEHVEHRYTDQSVYWVTWGGSFSAPPRRMAPRSVAPSPGRHGVRDVHAVAAALRGEQRRTTSGTATRTAGCGRTCVVARRRPPLPAATSRQPASGDGVLTARLFSHEPQRDDRDGGAEGRHPGRRR